MRWIWVGYGYKPQLPLYVGLALILMLWSMTALLQPAFLISTETHGTGESEGGNEAQQERSGFSQGQLLYIAEVVVPIVDLGHRNSWKMNNFYALSRYQSVVEFMLAVIGWVLAILAAVSLRAIIRHSR
jgi:hypothetical protein